MAKITTGCRVSSAIGPFGAHQHPEAVRTDCNSSKKAKTMRRKQIVFHGTVVASCPGELWRVHWDECNKLSDHKSSQLKFLSDHGSDFDHDLLTILLTNCDHMGGHDDILNWTKKHFTTIHSTNNNNSGLTISRENTTVESDITNTNNPESTVINNPVDVVTTGTIPPTMAIPSNATAGMPISPHEAPLTTNNTTTETRMESNVFTDADEADPDEEEEEVAIDELEIEKEMRRNMRNNRHAQSVATYHREKSALIDREVIIRGPGNHITTWTVVYDIKSIERQTFKEFHKEEGLIDFDFGLKNRTVHDKRGKYPRTNFCDLFRYLFPGDDTECLDKKEYSNTKNK